MRINEIKRWLVERYFTGARRNAVAILGAPGIGKSTIVAEAGEEIAGREGKTFISDYNDEIGEKILRGEIENPFVFVSLPLIEHSVIDLTGIPRENHDSVIFKPLLFAKVLSKTPGILFLDDFLDVKDEELLSSAYRITLERRIGYTKLNDGVMVVIASNTPEFSSLSRMFPSPLVNRLCIVEAETPKIEEWVKWMENKYGDNWDRRVSAFLYRFSEYFCIPPKEPELIENYPTPRSWTHLAIELMSVSDEKNVDEIAKGYIGKEVGSKFSAFCRVKVPTVEEMIERVEMWKGLTIDQKYLFAVHLGHWISAHSTAKAFEKIRNLLRELMKAEMGRQLTILTVLTVKEEARSLFVSFLTKMAEGEELFKRWLEDYRGISE